MSKRKKLLLLIPVAVAMLATYLSISHGIHVSCGGTQFESADGLFVVLVRQKPEWAWYEYGNDIGIRYLFRWPWVGGFMRGYAVFVPWWMIDVAAMAVAIGVIPRRKRPTAFPVEAK